MQDNSSNKSNSPLKFGPALTTFLATPAGTAAAGAAIGGIACSAGGLIGRGKRRQDQRNAQADYNKMKKSYRNLDTSNLYADVQNPYAGMENAYEDLTVNQKQAQFQAQQGNQGRADLMQNLRGAAGGSGIASLAQAMANQQTQQTQQISASIGQQESYNKRLQAGEAARLQQLKRDGEYQALGLRLGGEDQSRALKSQMTSTLFGMSQQRLVGSNQAISSANQMVASGFGQVAGAVGNATLSGAFKKPDEEINETEIIGK